MYYIGFPWSECQYANIHWLTNLATSHCTNIEFILYNEQREAISMRIFIVVIVYDTRGRVYSHRLSYLS